MAMSAHGVEALDQIWISAIKAGDVDRVVALYAPDATMYPPERLEAIGREAIRQSFTEFLGAFSIQDIEADTRHETVGDLSYGWGRFTLKMTPRVGGTQQTVTVRAVAVARRINGEWRYVLDHASAPLPAPTAESALS